MFDGVSHIFIHTFGKLIIPQVFIEEIDMFECVHVFIDTFEN